MTDKALWPWSKEFKEELSRRAKFLPQVVNTLRGLQIYKEDERTGS